MNIGFSYIGLIFLLMLVIPNIIWSKAKPKNYEAYAKNENKVLLVFERVGEILVTCIALIFTDFNITEWSVSSLLLIIAFILMVLYEIYWIKYFKSDRTMQDMYSSLIGIPVAGATLPVFAFLLLGLYGNSILMILATVILGIGHIGIHLNHYKKLVTEKVNIKKKVLKIISIFIGIIVVHSSASLAYKTYQLNELEKMSSSDMIEYVTKNDDNTKISVAVIKDGKVEYKIYGTNMEEEKQIYDYEIGSISKTYVSLLLSKAVEDNKINMNDSINKYLELDNDKYYPTIERLVTHTSGYNAYYFDPQMIANKFSQDNDFYGISKKDILNKIDSIKLKDKDYEFEYSNFGISVLGLVLEKVYDKDFTALMNEFITEEIGIKNTKVVICEGNLGNYWNWKKDDGYIPAGAIISNIEDMAEYLQMYLNSDEQYVVNTYAPKKEIHVDNYMYNKLGINMDKVGMAWMIDSENNFVWHNGATSNFNSYIAFIKEKNIGVVVLSNLSPNKKIPATVIGGKMMQELCGN